MGMHFRSNRTAVLVAATMSLGGVARLDGVP
jgi:hypothetical protein